MRLIIIDGAAAATDPNFSDVILLLHCDGADGGTSFTDSSPLANTMLASSLQTETSDPQFGSARAKAVGGGGSVATSAPSTSAPFAPLHNGSNWTFEGFFKFDSFAATQVFFSNASSTSHVGLYASLTTSRGINLQVYYGSAGNYICNGSSAGGVWPNDSSYHFLRITCDFSLGSNNYKVYVDDMTTPVAQFSKTGNTPSAADPTYNIVIGEFAPSGNPLIASGGFDEIRITKDVVRAGATPTEAFPDS